MAPVGSQTKEMANATDKHALSTWVKSHDSDKGQVVGSNSYASLEEAQSAFSKYKAANGGSVVSNGVTHFANTY